jgi:hypothetical protein
MMRQARAALATAEARRAELIARIDLKVVGGATREFLDDNERHSA